MNLHAEYRIAALGQSKTVVIRRWLATAVTAVVLLAMSAISTPARAQTLAPALEWLWHDDKLATR